MIPRSPVGAFSPGSNAPQTFKATTGPFRASASPPVDWGQGKEAQVSFIVVCFRIIWTRA